MKSYLNLFWLFWAGCFCILSGNLSGQSLLKSGPMLGYAEMREVCIWIQTSQPASVKIYHSEASENPSAKNWQQTNPIETIAEDAFTAKFVIDRLKPGTFYNYIPEINGEKLKFNYPLVFQTLPLWQHRNPPPDFKFVIGSCSYVNDSLYDRPGKPYGGDQQIYEAIFRNRPQMMLWLGDNIYLREADEGSRTAVYDRYSQSRALPQLQQLLASTHHYAIWDDHDYGPNDADHSYRDKYTTLDAFRLFWPNPTFGIEPGEGITTTFSWSDAQFFLLDNRFFRSNNKRKTGERTLLGKKQLEWLIDALKYSKAAFKFVAVGGQMINPAAVFENYAAIAPDERKYLLETIKAERIPGVIFLTGDRHVTELTVLPDSSFYPIYDLTSSPLTSSPVASSTSEKENNYLRVPGTMINVRNFALLEIVGGEKDRRLLISVHDALGTALWNVSISAEDLKPKSASK